MRSLRLPLIVLLLSSMVAFVPDAHSQAAVGVQKFGTYDGFPDTVDVGSLGIHLEIPLYRRAGRGNNTAIDISLTNYTPWPHQYTFSPDGKTHWLSVGPSVTFGLGASGTLTNATNTHRCLAGSGPSGTYTDAVWTYMDARGNTHLFPGSSRALNDPNHTCSGITAYGLIAQASDGSGYLIQISSNVLSTTVTDASGTLFSWDASSGLPSLQDSNGNTLLALYAPPTTDNYGNISSYTKLVQDTVNTSIQMSGGGFSTDGTKRQPLLITYLDDNGNRQTITVSYKIYPYSQNPSTNDAGLVEAVTYPDGSAYHFTYLLDANGVIAGVQPYLTSVTLPSGGVISYTYPNGVNGTPTTFCCWIPSLTRTTTDGTTTYARTITASAPGRINASFTNIAKSNGDQTNVYFVVPQHYAAQGTFGNGNPIIGWFSDSGKTMETKRVEYDHSNPSTPIRTTTRCYNGTTGDCTSVVFNEPVTQLAVTTTLDNGQISKTVTQYTGMSLPTEIDGYDFGASSPTRKTVTSYASLGNNISDRPASVIVYDAVGNVAKKTTYSYDETTPKAMTLPGHVTVTGSRGNATSVYRWNNASGTNLLTKYTYDDAGQVTSTTDPNLNVTTYAYDAATDAYRTKITRPTINSVAHVSTSGYGPNSGLVTSAYDENNQLTSYTYDSMYRPSSISYPDGGQTTFSYTPTSKTTNRLLKSGVWITNVEQSDTYGRVSQTRLTSDPEGTTYTDTTYDSLGRVYTVSNPYRSTSDSTYGLTTYRYDALGRVCVTVPPDGTAVSGNTCPATQPTNDVFTTYSANTTTVTDQAGKSRKSVTDGLGHLTQVFEDPAVSNYETDYTYDALDNLLTVNQKGGSTNSANWRTRTFTYNSLSQLLIAANPESGTITYSYDSNGNLLTKVAPAPNQTGTATVTTTYTYDALNRLTQKTFSDSTSTVKYGYDAIAPAGCTLPTLTINNGIGERTGMCDAAGTEAWSYDITAGAGWKITDARTTNRVTKSTIVQNNLAGSPATLTYPSGRVITYSYDAAGRPVSAIDSTGPINYATAATYTPPGGLASLTNGASVVSTLYFNSRLQPCRISVKSSGTAPANCTDAVNIGNVLDFSYNFSVGTTDNGDVSAITNNRDTTRSQSFSYDALNRIANAKTTSTSGTTCWDESLGYDAWGNLLTIGRITGYTCSNEELLNVSATAQNRISGDTYDTAGNLTAIPSIATYTYNAENQLTSAGGVTYSYDGDGKRVQKSSGKLYWYGIGSDPLDETDLAGNTNNSSFNEYVFFGGKRIARRDYQNNVNYYFADHLGTARIVANSSGTVLDDSDFYPFGGERVVTSSSGNHYKFTGKERDSESGLDNFGARQLGSSLGRFQSPDPEQIDGLDHMEFPQAWNGYAYVHNNPLSDTDPDGLDCIYINNDTGKYEGFNRGDCDNSTEAKANTGYYVNGNVDIINLNGQGQVTGYSGTGDTPGRLIAGRFLTPALPSSDPDQLSSFAQGVLSQPVLKNAAGLVNAAGMAEYRAAGFIFPLPTLLIDLAVGTGSSGTSASQAAVRRKPGSLGEFKGTDALRKENKMARDIMKELGLGEDAKALVHEALSEGAKDAGRKLTFKEGLIAVKAALGLLR